MKFNIEMCYTTNINIVVNAEDQESAIKKAKEIIAEEVSIHSGRYTDTGDLEFEQLTYISKHE